jgi:hypothetical protein
LADPDHPMGPAPGIKKVRRNKSEKIKVQKFKHQGH